MKHSNKNNKSFLANPGSTTKIPIDKIKNLDLFSKIPADELKKFSEQLDSLQIKEGNAVFTEGDPAEYIFVVLYGAIKLTRTTKSDATEAITHFLTRGDITVALINTTSTKYPISAYALEDSEILCIPKDLLFQTMMKVPALFFNVINHMNDRLVNFHADKAMSGKTVAIRLAEFLIRTADQHHLHYGGKIPFPLTRNEIASRLGTTKETIIRLMSSWNKKGWIKTNNQHIHVVDKTAIKNSVK